MHTEPIMIFGTDPGESLWSWSGVSSGPDAGYPLETPMLNISVDFRLGDQFLQLVLKTSPTSVVLARSDHLMTEKGGGDIMIDS